MLHLHSAAHDDEHTAHTIIFGNCVMIRDTLTARHGVLRCGGATLVSVETVAYVEADQCVVAGSFITSHFDQLEY